MKHVGYFVHGSVILLPGAWLGVVLLSPPVAVVVGAAALVLLVYLTGRSYAEQGEQG